MVRWLDFTATTLFLNIETGLIQYNWWQDKQINTLSLKTSGDAYLADDSSEESFITEHYWGYAQQRNGSTVEYQVEHPKWKVWSGTECKLECNVVSIYGQEFLPFLSVPPSSVFLADGSEVTVYMGKTL